MTPILLIAELAACPGLPNNEGWSGRGKAWETAVIEGPVENGCRQAAASPWKNRSAEGKKCNRRISEPAGRALEILGHAIQYLEDELPYTSGSPGEKSGRLEAIKMLMGVNREIYTSCPIVPAFRDRLRTFFDHLVHDRVPFHSTHSISSGKSRAS